MLKASSEVRKMNAKRGQAALEFLTTYGWAFLVILVMIGALSYFGVISPNKFLPERCTFQQEVTCKDFVANGGGAAGANLQFFLTNNLGNGIGEATFTAKSADGVNVINCAPAGVAAPIPSGEALGFTCDGTAGTLFDNLPTTGVKTKFIVSGTYKEVGGQYDRALKGEIFVTLQP
jgi:hypothetical protein